MNCNKWGKNCSLHSAHPTMAAENLTWSWLLRISFADGDVLSRFHALQRFSLAVGPSNADPVYTLGRAGSEVNAHIVVGKVAASTAHLADLRPPAGFDLDAGADRIAIAGGPNQAKADPRFAVAAVIPVETRPGIDIDHKNINVSVVVVIPECRAA
jgi:hypothetical protein